MEWKKFSSEKPALSQEILVLKSMHRGGYEEGFYIAQWEFFNGNEYVIIKELLESNRNNWRVPQEFLAWMPLPEVGDLMIKITGE